MRYQVYYQVFADFPWARMVAWRAAEELAFALLTVGKMLQNPRCRSFINAYYGGSSIDVRVSV